LSGDGFRHSLEHDRNPLCAQFEEHVRLFDERVAMMSGLKREKVPNSSGFVVKAGKWLDDNPPLHDVGGDGLTVCAGGEITIT
jgi:hypothetical protein